jgi:hypothetical protein
MRFLLLKLHPMNKKLGLILIVCGLLFYCCKKNSSTPAIAKSQWTLDGITYTPDTTYLNPALFDLQSYDTANNFAVIEFHEIPTTGTYTVIGIGSVTNSSEIGPTQCLIVTGQMPDITTQFGSLDSGTVKVNVVGGKITVTCTNVILTNDALGGYHPFSCTITQQN